MYAHCDVPESSRRGYVMICSVCYTKAGKCIIYFGKIYFPIRQIKYIFILHLNGLASSDLENSFMWHTSLALASRGSGPLYRVAFANVSLNKCNLGCFLCELTLEMVLRLPMTLGVVSWGSLISRPFHRQQALSKCTFLFPSFWLRWLGSSELFEQPCEPRLLS